MKGGAFHAGAQWPRIALRAAPGDPSGAVSGPLRSAGSGRGIGQA